MKRRLRRRKITNEAIMAKLEDVAENQQVIEGLIWMLFDAVTEAVPGDSGEDWKDS